MLDSTKFDHIFNHNSEVDSKVREVIGRVLDKLFSENVVFHANQFAGYTRDSGRITLAAGGVPNDNSPLPPRQFTQQELLAAIAEVQQEIGLPVTKVAPSSSVNAVDSVSQPSPVNKAIKLKLEQSAKDTSLALGA